MSPTEPQHCIEDFCGSAREQAARWQRTLLPVLERYASPLLTKAELERMAVENSARHFAHPKSVRHVRRMIKQVIHRDGGRNEWGRPELYLAKNAAITSSPVRAGEEPFAELLDAPAGFTNPAAPTSREEATFLLKAWGCYQRMLLRGRAPKKAKAELLAFLWLRMPWLSDSRAGLTAKIARKFHHYEQQDGAPVSLLDGRAARAGEARATPFKQEHLDAVIFHAVKNCGRRIAQTVEDLLARGEEFGLDADFMEFLLTHRGAGASSYVNRRLLNAVKPEVEMLRPYLLGRKGIDDATAPLQRSYDKLRSMTVVNADDFTMPVYCWLKDAAGNPVLDEKRRPKITRGQVLIFIDVRSRKIIQWVLIPDRNYTALGIRTCMNMVCREHGIPAVWYFEGGIWEKSKAVKEVAPNGWAIARSPEEFTFGWETLGARFIHAIRARTKPVEKIGDLLQRLMEGEPGYCGRDERRDSPAETKLAKLAVEARRDHPSKHFFSFDQWEARLGQIIERYNTKPQGGLLAGKSPDEVFEACWPHDDPPAPLNASCWHLGAHYVREFTVGTGGITFTFGKRTFSYWDENLSSARHRKLRAWFNPETPEFIAVTDLNDATGKTARFVARHNPVEFLAALDPDSPEAEAYRREVAKQQGFNAYPKARYHTIKAKFKQSFRTVVLDTRTAAMSKALQQGSDEKRAAMRSEESRRRRVRKRAESLGLAGVVGDGDQFEEEGLAMMENARRVLQAKSEVNPDES